MNTKYKIFFVAILIVGGFLLLASANNASAELVGWCCCNDGTSSMYPLPSQLQSPCEGRCGSAGLQHLLSVDSSNPPACVSIVAPPPASDEFDSGYTNTPAADEFDSGYTGDAVCPDGYYWDATRETEGGLLPGACVRTDMPATDEFDSGYTGAIPGGNSNAGQSAIPGGNSNAANSQGGVSMPNFLGVTTVGGLVTKIVDFLMLLVIPLAGLMIVWAGFQFVTAQGSEDKLKTAKKNLAWTVIGVAVVFASRAIIGYVQEVLGGNTGQDSALMTLFRTVVNQIIVLLFALVTVYFFWGVVQFVKGSGSGDTKALEAGKQHMIWGIIGMAVMLGAWGIVQAIQGVFA